MYCEKLGEWMQLSCPLMKQEHNNHPAIPEPRSLGNYSQRKGSQLPYSNPVLSPSQHPAILRVYVSWGQAI